MSKGSAIEWTESTWNPVTGCSKISPGCKHCYAERMAKRLQAMGVPQYADAFAVTIQERVLESPLSWKKPQTIFVNSMSDLFGPRPNFLDHQEGVIHAKQWSKPLRSSRREGTSHFLPLLQSAAGRVGNA